MTVREFKNLKNKLAATKAASLFLSISAKEYFIILRRIIA